MLHSINPRDMISINGADGTGRVTDTLKRRGSGFKEVLKNTLNDEENAGPGRSKVRDKKLWNVCIEAESLFVAKMLKQMRQSVPKSGFLHGGFAEEIFQDMLYDQYALQLSKNSNLGMAGMLYDELSRKQ